MYKKGLSDVVSNTLLVLIVVAGVAIIGAMVINLTNSAGDSTRIKECEFSNIDNTQGYNDCIIKAFGEVRGKQILGLEEEGGTWDDYVHMTGYNVIDASDIDGGECYLRLEVKEEPVLYEESIDGLSLHYDFSNSARDLSINNNDGLGRNGLNYVNVDGNTFARFDGVDDYIQVPKNESLNLREMTVSFWFRGRNGTIMSDSYYGSTSNYVFNFKDEDTIVQTSSVMRTVTDSLGRRRPVLIDVLLESHFDNINNWHLYTFTRDYTGFSSYIDGNFVSSTSLSNLEQVSFYDNPVEYLIIGAHSPNSFGNPLNDFYSGDLDEIMLFNRAITSSEVAELYNRGGILLNGGGVSNEFSLINSEPLYGDYLYNTKPSSIFGNEPYSLNTYDSSNNLIDSYLMFPASNLAVVYTKNNPTVNNIKIFAEGKGNPLFEEGLTGNSCTRTCGNKGDLITHSQECCEGTYSQYFNSTFDICTNCGDDTCDVDEKYKCERDCGLEFSNYYLTPSIFLSGNAPNVVLSDRAVGECFVFEYPSNLSSNIVRIDSSMVGKIINGPLFNNQMWWWQINGTQSSEGYMGWAMDNCLMRQ